MNPVKFVLKLPSLLAILLFFVWLGPSVYAHSMVSKNSIAYPFMPCVDLSWNDVSECLNVTRGTTTCTGITSDILEWRDEFGTYAPLPASGSLCGCDVYEYLTVTPVCQVSGGNFLLGGQNFQRCPGRCLSRTDFTFPQGSSNITNYPACAQTINCITITPAELMSNGGMMTAYYRSNTEYGTVVTIIRFTYNGNGLNCSNISSQIIQSGKIYKDIRVRRTITSPDCNPSVSCEQSIDIPQPMGSCLTELFVNTVNVGNPCNASGFGASTINATFPVTYEWSYNGSVLADIDPIFCLSGRPLGMYCVKIRDANGCMAESCRGYLPGCTLGVSVTQSGRYLQANLTNCASASPHYIWARWVGSSWVTVGTNSPYYDTGGIAGEFRVTVTCASCISQGTIISTAALPALPVDLKSFYTTAGDCSDVTIHWETLSESNNQHFRLEKSQHDQYFKTLAIIEGKNTKGGAKYSFIDDQMPINGVVNYYRLSQIDFDGKETKYDAISHRYDCTKDPSGLIISPVPAFDAIQVTMAWSVEENVVITIKSIDGNLIHKVNMKSTESTKIDISDFKAGIYWLEAVGSATQVVKKFIKI
ncbi:MAG: T9SS type A sorting domain-containing protein [Saprospiraceae bacterium]